MSDMFDAKEAWTTNAAKLDRKLHAALKPILQEYADKGFSVRDIAHVMMHVVFGIECETIVLRRMEARKHKEVK